MWQSFRRNEVNPSYNREGDADIYIAIKTDPISMSLAEKMNAGDVVMDADGKTRIGKIYEFELVEHIASDENEKISDNEELCSAVIIVKCNAMAHNGYYTVDEKKILVSENNEYIIPGLYFTGDIISFSKNDDAGIEKKSKANPLIDKMSAET